MSRCCRLQDATVRHEGWQCLAALTAFHKVERRSSESGVDLRDVDAGCFREGLIA